MQLKVIHKIDNSFFNMEINRKNIFLCNSLFELKICVHTWTKIISPKDTGHNMMINKL